MSPWVASRRIPPWAGSRTRRSTPSSSSRTPTWQRLLFHELGHQRVFARGDTDFNEAFATTVGQEGARRCLKAKGDTAAFEAYLAHLRRTEQFIKLIMAARARLEALYGDARTEDGKVKTTAKNHNVPPEQLRQQKQRAFEDLKAQYAALKPEWNGDAEYDDWFARELNNSHLNSVAAYYEFVPGFERLLARNGGDLEKFYQAVEALSKKPKKERHHYLRRLGRS